MADFAVTYCPYFCISSAIGEPILAKKLFIVIIRILLLISSLLDKYSARGSRGLCRENLTLKLKVSHMLLQTTIFLSAKFHPDPFSLYRVFEY